MMSKARKILGLIPARRGSKRLPGKNIKVLGELPLIAWTIRAAMQSGVCTDVMVSTDDPQIAEISKQYGATVPGLRPSSLATETASSVDVAIHALDVWGPSFDSSDGLMLLQPTSPFRQSKTICQAVQLFCKNDCCAVVGVSPVKSPPAWCFHVAQETMVPVLGWDGILENSQTLEPVFALNGAMYIVRPDILRARRTFVPKETCPQVFNDPAEALDIDTPWDWTIACALLPHVYRERGNFMASNPEIDIPSKTATINLK